MRKARRLVLIGTGETAAIACEYFTHDSSYEVVAFSAEEGHMSALELAGHPVVPLESLESSHPPDEHDVYVAVSSTGLNRLRARLFAIVKSKGYRCATYVSSRAFVWRNAIIGENCFVFEHNTIQPFVQIGDNVTLWSGNHIGHRSVIEDHCFLSSHVVVSGYCRIGASSFVGVNATFRDQVCIAPDTVIGAGSLVVRSFSKPGTLIYGAPAKEAPNRSSFDVAL